MDALPLSTFVPALLFGTHVGQFVLLIGGAAITIVLFAACLVGADLQWADYAVATSNSSLPPLVEGDVAAGAAQGYILRLWDAYTYFVDPGTQTGLRPDDDPAAVVVVSVVCSLVGFVWIMYAFGVAVERMGALLKQWERNHARIVASGHTLVVRVRI